MADFYNRASYLSVKKAAHGSCNSPVVKAP